MRLASSLVFLTACASQVHVTPTVDTHPAHVSAITTVALAPIDVTLPIGPDQLTESPELRSMTKSALEDAASSELTKRAFAIGRDSDATLFIKSGAFVPKATLGDETFTTERESDRELPYSGPIGAAVFSELFCGDNVACAAQVATSLYVRPPADEDTILVMRNDDKVIPPEGDPALYVGMTLVENKTGAILWRAHGTSAVNATNRDQVATVVRTVIASLPARSR